MSSCFFVAGETSGDRHAAEVVREMRRLAPEVEVHAYGGNHLREAGAEVHYPFTEMASVGFDWVWKVFEYRRLGIEALEICRRRGIRTLVLVDFPGFNLRLATAAKEAGMQVIYYITPQVWAWRYSRVRRMKRDLDLALVIFPFEEPLLQAAGIPTCFVGHPLVDQLANPRPAETVCRENGLPFDPQRPLIGLLPGSRRREVERLAPVLVETAILLSRQFPSAHFVVPRAETIAPETLRAHFPSSLSWTLVEKPSHDLRSALRMSITKSGTSTLENAVLGVPQVVVYKGRALDAFVARRLVRVKWLGLVNILAGREICPEFLQEDCVASKIADGSKELVYDTPARGRMLKDLSEVRLSLGEGQASVRAAYAILERMTK